MKKLLTIVLCLGLVIGSHGCSKQKSSDELNQYTDIFKEYPKKENNEIDHLLFNDYKCIIDPYIDTVKNKGLFSFELSPIKYIVNVSGDEMTKVEIKNKENGDKAIIYSIEDGFEIDTENQVTKDFINFLEENLLNYMDFLDWIVFKFNEDRTQGIDTLSYEFKTKTKKEVYDILKKNGYTIEDGIYSTGINMESSQYTLYFDGIHYNAAKEGDTPFIDLKIKDKTYEKLYNSTMAYHIYYDFDCHYLRAAIVYTKKVFENVQVLDITPNARSIAGDFIQDDKRYISKDEMEAIKDFHQNIEKTLLKFNLSMADIIFFMLHHYGDYKN